MTAGAESRVSVLVADDSEDTREVLRRQLESAGHRVATVCNVAEAVEALGREEPALVISDIRMPGPSGLDLVRHVRDNFPNAEVVVITGFASVAGAVEAVKTGAQEYLAKPFTEDELFAAIDRALERRQRRLATRVADFVSRPGPSGLVGDSPPMRAVFRFIDKAAASGATVLITGESGTGKELVARAIHYRGPRVDGPFAAVNCAAIPESLLESELFGHVRGAFTGAVATRAGFFLTADRGTIFLDEIGEVSPATQVKLLRVLQDKEITLVGDARPRTVDVRIIAATNKDLEVLVRQGGFREDLFYRLNVLSVTLPPLRERGLDVCLLARQFARKFSAEQGRREPQFTDRALDALTRHDWPGNVRELENVIQRTLLMSDRDEIDTADLPMAMRFHAVAGADEPLSLADAEATHIRRILERCDYNRSESARVLGIDRKTLREKMRRYGLGSD